MLFEAAITRVLTEFQRATNKYTAFASPHEGYAVILEKLNELEDLISSSRNDRIDHKTTQICAMAIRFLVDVFDADTREALQGLLTTKTSPFRGQPACRRLRYFALIKKHCDNLWAAVKANNTHHQDQAVTDLAAAALASLMSGHDRVPGQL